MAGRTGFGWGAAAGVALIAVIIAGIGTGRTQEAPTAARPAPLVLAQNTPASDGAAGGQRGSVTNLPLPRYVSLKGNEGNARRGPSLSHRIDWVFRHAGMPLRVVAEFGHWRRVEDRDGAGGWVHYALLSGVRTALVTQDMAELRTRPDPQADVVARAEAGAIVRLGECKPDWCRVTGGGERGWLLKSAIWGVDRDETRD
ncbi:SH3 domain-containing protein [Paracoccus sp. (in: a-proteobacteria)]|uniref:SH3 domain-containing protein n=1 Tax=Paracoccus sp. TaxID=267 RepID=UPI003A8844C9